MKNYIIYITFHKSYLLALIKLAIILNITFFCTHRTAAQGISPSPFSKQFTVDEGLPSNEVYHVVQDSLGFIWLATSSGVSQFNGNRFKNFGIEDGLTEASIYELYIDYTGRIWFLSGNGSLTYYEQGGIKLYPFNSKIKENITTSRGNLKNSFYVDSAENVHISLRRYGRAVVSSEGLFKKLGGIHQEGEIVVEKMNDSTFLISNPSNAPTYDIIFVDEEQPFRFTCKELYGKIYMNYHFFFLPGKDKTYLMADQGFMYRIKGSEIIERKHFSQDIIWASIDKNNNLWVAPIDGGVYCFKNADFSCNPDLYLFDNIKITSVLLDREGGYWFTSLSHGVFYCPNINIRTYNESNGLPKNRVNAVFSNRKAIYAGYEHGVVSEIKDDGIRNYIIAPKTTTQVPIRFIGIDTTSSDVWVGSSYYLNLIRGETVKTYHPTSSLLSGTHPRQMLPAHDNGYWIASNWGLKKFDGNRFTYDSRLNNEFSGLIYSIALDSSGVLWMCCSNGIWVYENKFYRYLGEESPSLSQPSNYITFDNSNRLLIGTKGIGLIIKEGDKITQYTKSDGLASNTIKKIVVNNDNYWLATNNGISWIKKIDRDKLEIQNITTSQGLPTNDINDIHIKGSLVYVGTSKGLSVFNTKNLLPNPIKPKCTINEVRVNNKTVDTRNKSLKLSYYHSFLSFEFYGLTYKSMGKMQFRYRMLGIDSSWVCTNNSNAIFSKVPHGKYTFEVQTQNADGAWSNSDSIGVTIAPPYWQTFWFIFLSTLVFSGFIFVIYLYRIKTLKKQNTLINSANEYKQQSLRQQMNPHFIFNTLNSIQLFILEKDSISSHKYLTKFARLMRITLDNSQESIIPLKKELEALTLYLELESLRLEGKFTYSIEVADNDVLEQKVPTLLIQPFVENAIWHGIMLKESQNGFVNVIISRTNETMTCTIEDNGVGRERAMALRAKNEVEHKSLGYKITSQRIELLNTLYKEKFNIHFTDLYSSDGVASGTKVHIQIPYNLSEGEAK
ncbi:MAG TPA: histidine kinase [Tenuifilaceae bacterium]|nr:histidine kinase [Tenuifilaceae bacterium]HPE18876.1 histidine kinase [Tenuifilaceae bacterium]HPJ46333.1 histidine kinase [Tenuifilaceae bacterium]HPQ35030.1 histidine kinase [Tenuifilaceae bacterium]HRX68347.1 histidine kinase [Tenuifilaceae bacterium]